MSKFFTNFARTSKLTLAINLASVATFSSAANLIENPGFEVSWSHWERTAGTAKSNVAHSGKYSGKISGTSGNIQQMITVQPDMQYRLSAQIKGAGKLGVDVNGKKITTNGGSDEWETVSTTFHSGNSNYVAIFGAANNGEVRFDNFQLQKIGATPQPQSCVSPTNLKISAASDNNTHDGHAPALTIDNKLNDDSRWSSGGDGKWIQYDLGTVSDMTAMNVAWYNGNTRTFYFDVEVSTDKKTWTPVLIGGQSSGATENFERVDVADASARYVRIVGYGNSYNEWNSIIETKIVGCGESTDPVAPVDPTEPPPSGGSGTLDPTKPPSSNFDLLDWDLSIPTDNDKNGRSDTIPEKQLADGFKDSRFFFTGKDGGMVFRVPVKGAKTSNNTQYTRVELREMLRRGNTEVSAQGVNKNNWVFSSAPSSDKNKAGGVDGELQAELAVNHVTTTGTSDHIGRVIVGQIHANDDEPLRIYYRKLPNNSKGSIYVAHDMEGGGEDFYNMIGSKHSFAANPDDGVALNEKFGYRIKVTGNTLLVTITRAGKPDVKQTINMSNSDYDNGGQYMYFKAGAYNQNSSGHDNDYAQVTFYKLKNIHNGYAH